MATNNQDRSAQVIDLITTKDLFYDDSDGGEYWPQKPPGFGWEDFFCRRWSEHPQTSWRRVRSVDGGAVGDVPGGRASI